MASPNTFYVTTPIYYVNADPHLGSSYTTIMCDIFRRYADLLGRETYFLTGTDEHGEKIFREAREKGRDVREMVDDISRKFRDLWPHLDISNDDFIRTTEERHTKVVSAILQRTWENGDIYMAEYGGNYCVACERYYTDRETESTPGHCPIHERPLEYIQEKNYFFRLSKYQDWLRKKIEDEPEFLQPEQYRREVLALLREPLDDLCISRPAERLHWGIPIPFDKKYVTYVWYDALVNYLSGIGYPDEARWEPLWANCMHVTAKDILRQHAVYWPCFLEAAGIPVYKCLRVHGFWTVEGRKISKSLGNAIDPMAQVRQFGLDVFRYFLAREMSFGADGDYNGAGVAKRNNGELANDLGNLLSRVTVMIEKYCEGKLPELENPTESDHALMARLNAVAATVGDRLESASIHLLLEELMSVVAATNRYVTEQAPWSLMKEGNTGRVGTVLAVAARLLAGAGQLLWPVMPRKMEALLASLGAARATTYDPDILTSGATVKPVKDLFPQIEAESVVPDAVSAEEAPAEEPAAIIPEPIKEQIEFDDFAKIDLRIARVLAAEPVPKTDKLLKLRIDVGADERQIIAGIAAKYKPEDLIGRRIVVVANLAPRKLRGETSQGMLLAARSGDDGLFLLGPDGEALPGSEVS